MTALLGLACVAVFLRLAMLAPEHSAGLFARLALVPSALLSIPPDPEQLLTLLTASFLHAGWLHLGGNMLYLAVFGPPVEDRLGPARFLALYLASGAIGLIAHSAFHTFSSIPVVGASASIAGLLGAHLVLLPRTKVTTVIPVIVAIEVAALPSAFLVGLWFLLQVAGALSASGSVVEVAWITHIGGFVAGALLATVLSRPGRKRERRR